MIAPADLQAAAMAEFARRLRLSRIFVLDDYGYGAPMAAGFQVAAQHLNIQLAGVDSWKPNAHSFAPLAAEIARSHADGVYVSGLYSDGAGAVIRALRQRLGSGVTILANDGSLPVARLFQHAGIAARGVYISSPFLPNAELPLRGRDFVARFAATQHQGLIDPAAVYAAQATEVLLDAIGHSSGTRESVTHALLTSCTRNGILGGLCINRSGDPSTAAITIVRARRLGGSTTAGSIDGGTVVAVMRPPTSLTR